MAPAPGAGATAGCAVTGLAMTPVKGTRVRAVDFVDLDRTGASGNRAFYLVDDRGRMINGKQLGALQTVIAELCDGVLSLTLPGGRRVSEPVRLGAEVQTRFFSDERIGRLVDGPFSQALSDCLGRPLRLVDAGGAVDRGRQGAVSLVSRGSLRRLAEVGELDDIDCRRFRMLIEVDGVDPHAEDRWVGRETRVGAAIVRWHGHVGRCLVTSRDPESGDVDIPTLDLLGEYRRDLDSTEPLPFGIYGEVLKGGRVGLGDPILTVN